MSHGTVFPVSLITKVPRQHQAYGAYSFHNVTKSEDPAQVAIRCTLSLPPPPVPLFSLRSLAVGSASIQT